MGQSGERTEKATPKKRQDARKEGNVLKSQDMNTAIAIVAMFGALLLFAGTMNQIFQELLVNFLSGSVVTARQAGMPEVLSALRYAFTEYVFAILPIFAVAVIVGLASNFLQVGFLFTTKSIMPKFSRINPLQGFKRIFSMRSLVELVKAVLKMSVFSYIVYGEYMKHFEAMPTLIGYEVSASLLHIFNMCKGVAFKCAIAFVVIGAADYLYQWFDYEKNLKMTKQEIKDEYKQIEGDPKVKSKIKQRQMEMSRMRMMQSVPTADVVITNPTHYAVALKYDEKSSRAPVVIAKGKDHVAQRIKAVAAESGVELVENRMVAQALYLSADLGQEIPEELFKAVAEILAFVFKQKKNASARAERERMRMSLQNLFQ